MEYFLVGPICNLFVTEIWVPIKKHLGYCFCTGANIAKLDKAIGDLRHTKEIIKEKIQEAELEQKQPNQEVTDWMVRAEDTEIECTNLKNEYNNRRIHLCGCSYNFLTNFKTGKSVTKKMNTLNELISNKPTEISTIIAPAVREVPTSLYVVGQQGYLNKILGYLANRTNNIIGIHGMGGVGKTTLLESINNYHRSAEQIEYNHVIFVFIGKNPDLFMIQKDIARTVHLNLSDDDTVQSRAVSLFNFFRKKSFLLLLDDLWESVDLKRVGIPPLFDIMYKQKIIFTTRLSWICGRMQANKRLEVCCLKMEDAWDLFKSKIGEAALSDARIQKEAKVLATKCCGLPLAINAVGLAMSDKTFKEWQDTIKLLRRYKLPEILKEEDKLFPVLKVSYDNLKDETKKKCFLFCSLICQKQTLSARFIIERWIGLGCFEELDNIEAAYDMGHFVLESLMKASLLEGDTENDQIKMHDVMADLALWIACDCQMQSEKWLVINDNSSSTGWRHAERVSIFPYCEQPQMLFYNCFPEEPIYNDNQKLLSVSFALCKSLSFIPAQFFLDMPTLKYLDLSHTGIAILPLQIGSLVNLEFLNLSNTNIRMLPKEAGNLVKLKYLHLLYAQQLSLIDREVLSKFVNLYLLNMYGTMLQLGVQGGIGFEEIECLSRLRYFGITVTDVLSFSKILNLPNITTLYLKIQDMQGITSLDLIPNNQIQNHRTKFLVELSLERCKSLVELVIRDTTRSLNRLEKLVLSSLLELRKIVWEGVEPHTCLINLVEIEITACKNLLDITWVLHLQSLKTLNIKYCAKMKQVIAEEAVASSGSMTTFPELKKFCLWDVPTMTKICNDEVSFPSLQSAQFVGCKNLKSLPLGMCETERNVEIRGYIDWWDGLEWSSPHLKSRMEVCFTSYD